MPLGTGRALANPIVVSLKQSTVVLDVLKLLFWLAINCFLLYLVLNLNAALYSEFPYLVLRNTSITLEPFRFPFLSTTLKR